MPFIPVPGAARAAVTFSLDGQPCQWELDVTVETVTAANMQDAAGALYNAVAEHVMPQMSADLFLNAAVAYGQTTENDPIGLYFPLTPTLGSVSSKSLPNNVALCVSKYTALRGRSFRGRLFLMGMPENSRSTPSYVTDAYMGNINTAMSGVLADMISAGFPPCVISRYTANAPRTTGIATLVTALACVDPVLDSQRRRLPGRGS